MCPRRLIRLRRGVPRVGLGARHTRGAAHHDAVRRSGFVIYVGPVAALPGGSRSEAGEPASQDADAAEGDGWLVATVYRPSEDRSDLVVFEAMDVAGGPIGWAELPRRVPFGFHGNWRAA